MRIHELFHALVDKFVPMDNQTKTDLQLKAVDAYNKIKAEGELIDRDNQLAIDYNNANKEKEDFKPEPLKSHKLTHRIIRFLELWWVRYIMAIAFVWLLPKIKDYINGVKADAAPEVDEDDDEDDESSEYMEFLKFKKMKRLYE